MVFVLKLIVLPSNKSSGHNYAWVNGRTAGGVPHTGEVTHYITHESYEQNFHAFVDEITNSIDHEEIDDTFFWIDIFCLPGPLPGTEEVFLSSFWLFSFTVRSW